jgi:hypothetical protein
VKVEPDVFESKNGIKLGMSESKVISLIGKKYKTTNTSKYKELIYYTEDTERGILKQLGGVAYFIKCRFVKNKLCQYNFGFEYP